MSATGVETASEIQPFQGEIPEEELAELRRRIAATRWPDRETVPDRSQGAQLAELQELVRYWGTDYVAQGGDWGAGLVEVMARQAPDGLLGIHTNLAAVLPPR